MAVNKNFVVKNGLEVAENLIFAQDGKVGVGSTAAAATLDVRGNINATDLLSSGVTTAITLNVGTGGTILSHTPSGFIGINSTVPAFLLDIQSPVSTGQTALNVKGDVAISGDINIDDLSLDQLNVSGVSTFGGAALFQSNVSLTKDITIAGVTTIIDARITMGTISGLNVTGMTTSVNAVITGATVGVLTATTATVTDSATTGATVGLLTATTSSLTDVSITGATVGVLTATSSSVGSAVTSDVTGVKVTGGVNVAGVVTATSFTGDGSGITGFPAGSIGISSGGTIIGTGASILDVTASNLTVTATETSAGISTLNIANSVSVGLVLALS